MKSNLKKNVGSIAIITAIVGMLAGCTAEKKEQIRDYDSDFAFDTRCAIEEGEDGWVYYFCCDYSKDKDSDVPFTYYFDGFNLKYETMEGYVVDIEDAEGNIIDQIPVKLPTLVYKSDYDDDIAEINEYFENLSPTDVISGEGLVLNDLDAEQVVRLFNEAIKSDKMKAGRYGRIPEADVLKSETINGYYWQVAYLGVYGQLVSVNIELIYDDGVYLSDMVAAGSADEGQKELEKCICDIEDKILETQELCLEDSQFASIKGVSASGLKSILKRIDKGSRE